MIPDIPGSVQLKIDIDETIAKLVLDDDEGESKVSLENLDLTCIAPIPSSRAPPGGE